MQDLNELSLIDHIHMHCVSGMTARLTATYGTDKAIFFFETGQLVHAQFHDLLGIEAVYGALYVDRQHPKHIKQEREMTTPHHTIHDSWDEIFEGILLRYKNWYGVQEA